MVPSLIERSSTLHFEHPVQVYAMKKGERAVRMTFRTGAQEYWGIQQTSWKDAPVLESKNVTRRFGNRDFDLYYDGARLHMVVLRTDQGTLLGREHPPDTLSNETMFRSPAVSGRSGEEAVSKIGFFGGWVGVVTSACFAELGHDVVVRMSANGSTRFWTEGFRFHEPGLVELIERNAERMTHARRGRGGVGRRLPVRLCRHAVHVLRRR